MYPSSKVHGSKTGLSVEYEDQLTIDSRCVGAEKHPRYATLLGYRYVVTASNAKLGVRVFVLKGESWPCWAVCRRRHHPPWHSVPYLTLDTRLLHQYCRQHHYHTSAADMILATPARQWTHRCAKCMCAHGQRVWKWELSKGVGGWVGGCISCVGCKTVQ